MSRIWWLVVVVSVVAQVGLYACVAISEEDSGSIEIPARFLQKGQNGRSNGIRKETAGGANISLLSFIGKVLNTAQHRYRTAVERARKKYGLSKTITKDAERLLAEAINIKL